MVILFLVSSLRDAPWSLICIIISLILLFFSAFVGPYDAEGPFYRRFNMFQAGMFFAVLAWALGGK